jgi:DNA-directed RNA polymerase subunit RPC12/RpoP
MAKRRDSSTTQAQRTVQCYLCGKRFEISAIAATVSCPGCFKPLLVEDVVVKGYQAVKKIQTCGRITVQKRGRVVAELVEAHEGVEMLGIMHANVVSGRPVRIGPRAEWKGDLRCPAVQIDPSANILGGYFVIPDRTLGLEDLPVRGNGRKR